MIDFENVLGFEINLSTEQECNYILDDIFSGDTEENYQNILAKTLQEKRDYILDYFTTTYKYVFCKAPNIYYICEDDLEICTKDKKMNKVLTTDLLLNFEPKKWQKHYGEYARIGLILEDYSIEDKIKYLIDNAYFDTTLNNFLEKQITEFIINMERN